MNAVCHPDPCSASAGGDRAGRQLEAMADLESAEDFLDFFAVDYRPEIVAVCRLHILQRFHDYLAQLRRGASDEWSYADYRRSLLLASTDFVNSDAQSEKVFSVLKRAAGISTLAVDAIGRARR